MATSPLEASPGAVHAVDVVTSSPMPTDGRVNQHIRFGSGGEARVVPVEEAAARPAVHDMQDKVARAFGAENPARPELSEGQRGRLEAMLTDLTDLKARLDAARLKKAA